MHVFVEPDAALSSAQSNKRYKKCISKRDGLQKLSRPNMYSLSLSRQQHQIHRGGPATQIPTGLKPQWQPECRASCSRLGFFLVILVLD